MAESLFSHLLNGARIVVDDDMESKGIGPKIGGGLRSAPSGMAFVDVTGRVDADEDGIVFEGIPGMERPIIPKFIVPKELAGKLSKLIEGDSINIERQRRAGNTGSQFDENEFNAIVESLKVFEDIQSKPRVGMKSTFSPINWDKPDVDMDDGAGGILLRWDLDDGSSYVFEYYPDGRFAPKFVERNPDGKIVFSRLFKNEKEGTDFLKEYHERTAPGGSGNGSLKLAYLEGSRMGKFDAIMGVFDAESINPEKLVGPLVDEDNDAEIINNAFMDGYKVGFDEIAPLMKDPQKRGILKMLHGNLSQEDKSRYLLDKRRLSGRDAVDAETPDGGMSSKVANTRWKGDRPPLRELSQNADLSGANLSNIDLSGSNLASANLRMANLENTNLSNADMSGANLFFANMAKANLSDSDLTNANLFAANVEGVNFSGALMPDMSSMFMIGSDSAEGLSARSIKRMGMQSLSTRDRRKLESFIAETVKEWERSSASLRTRSGADDPYQAVQEAYQGAIVKLLEEVEEKGIAAIDKYFRDSEVKSKIKDYLDAGVDDERVAVILDVSIKDIEAVRQFGVPSPARSWVNLVKRKAMVNVERDEARQKGKAPARRIAEQRLNNAVWDLIDAGRSDDEIIEAIRSNTQMAQPNFEQSNLDDIRKKGRVQLEEGVLGISQDITSFEAENARRGRGEEDWATGEELGTELAQEDLSDEDANIAGLLVTTGPDADTSEVSDEKAVKVKKLQEALKDSFDVFNLVAQRRGTRAGSERISLKEAAEELGISESLVQQHLALVKEIRKRVEDGRFNDPDWFIPFDEISELGKTPEGIEEFSKKYDLPIKQAQLLAKQVAGVRRRLDVKSTASQQELMDFSNEFTDLIKKGFSRGEIARMMPSVNSQEALNKRVALAARNGLIDEAFTDSEILAAIQSIRTKGTGAVGEEMLDKLRSLGIDVSNLVPKKQMTEEEKTFTAMQESGKTRGEIMSEMNLSKEQYQAIYMRLKKRSGK